ncbi:MAG: hypothetical protein IJV31_10195 [Clostridia bacterium]|nr:hypothetical protein [Clostridia bacterium]
MKILLIEDDTAECEIYIDIAKRRKDIEFISITNSSIKAIDDYKCYKPEAIILDLELNDGEGSGFDFLENLNKLNIKKLPKMVVTTNVHSDIVYDFCHKNNIDFVFYKKQKNYSQENIINTLLLLRDYDSNAKTVNVQDEKEQENSILYKINKELDLIGIGTHLHGRKYLCDAIYIVLQNDENYKVSIVQQLVAKYKKSSSTISRAMQNAILHAWRVTPLEDLTTYYTARINYETGVPTPTELIYYYADKIRKEL